MRIRHRTGEYEIRFEPLATMLGSLGEASFVLTDRHVASHYRALIPGSVPVLELDPGEGTKSAEAYLRAIEWLAKGGAQRDAVVVALGGGVIGDLAGFVAATYMRGVAYIQVPTTLLAQVDSSVGGKVGVDLPEGKNMLGAFHAPKGVWVSVDALSTLPPREFANGMAEVLKYGFIMAPEILEMDARRDTETVVRRCIECKKEVVEADEMETTGRRAILNFGHTVGHALERETGYRELLHGEAISVGMVVEAGLGERLGMAPEGTRAAVSARLEAEGLPIAHPALKEAGRLIAQMRRDKKAARGNLAFSLLRGIGSCEFVPNVPEADVLAALSH
ncbi:MAG TPA: 3-dehydroquinate synthase [Fimbriimonadaceae bacterium]|nr:3-dehydroquinate synthase [Fimbriimonadaceae bacterium]